MRFSYIYFLSDVVRYPSFHPSPKQLKHASQVQAYSCVGICFRMIIDKMHKVHALNLKKATEEKLVGLYDKMVKVKEVFKNPAFDYLDEDEK